MGSICGKIRDDYDDYVYICKLLNETPISDIEENSFYEHEKELVKRIKKLDKKVATYQEPKISTKETHDKLTEKPVSLAAHNNILKAKNYLYENGWGDGANFTVNSVAHLMMAYYCSISPNIDKEGNIKKTSSAEQYQKDDVENPFLIEETEFPLNENRLLSIEAIQEKIVNSMCNTYWITKEGAIKMIDEILLPTLGSEVDIKFWMGISDSLKQKAKNDPVFVKEQSSQQIVSDDEIKLWARNLSKSNLHYSGLVDGAMWYRSQLNKPNDDLEYERNRKDYLGCIDNKT